MKNEQLVLTPENIQYLPNNIPGLLNDLKQAGLISDLSSYCFKTGENFSGLISFLGCSPSIPESNKPDGLSITFEFYNSGARFLGGKNVSSPRCAKCKHEFSDWRQLLKQWQDNNNTLITCPGCNHETLVPALNWRYRAAFASCAIVINEISEGTALPADALLQLLENFSGCSWDYFYRKI